MAENSSFIGKLGASLIIFSLTAIISILLIVSAFTVWLSEIIGSLFGSMLIVGAFFLTISLLVYILSLREQFKQINMRLDTIYNVAETAQKGYLWIKEYLLSWITRITPQRK